ncbi:uncharacterized protein [Epargyreus clarus]|uniref:uncharacterized protein n=1 Tax=Epargyreus clarus TaxID=520877 RepID=UPI003C2D3D4D
MRQEAFKMLVQIFNEEIGRDTSLADFKKKLENMRTTYGRELKKVNASKQTGSGSNDIYVPALWYYPLFQFLEGTTEPCRPGTDTLDEASETESKGNVTSPDISASTSSTQIINTEICDKEGPADSGKSSQPKKQKMSIQSKQEKLLDAAQTLMTRQDDDWEIIGKHTVQPSPQPPQHHMMSQFPQASPEYNSTVQPFLQSIPQYTFEQPSSEYVNPTNATQQFKEELTQT